MLWQAAQETALLNAHFKELSAVPAAPSRTTMGGGGAKVVPAFRVAKRFNTLQVSAHTGWSPPGSTVLHGLCILIEAA